VSSGGPEFFAALYAVTAAVRDGDVDEGEVSCDVARGDWVQTLTVRISRYYAEEAAAEPEAEEEEEVAE
jgi:hypothetical protein